MNTSDNLINSHSILKNNSTITQEIHLDTHISEDKTQNIKKNKNLIILN